MEEELVDYSSNVIDTTQIWTVHPPQHPARQTLENPHVSNIQVGAFIFEMEDEVATINNLGFIQPNIAPTSEFLYTLHDEKPQPILKILSPFELQYWEYELEVHHKSGTPETTVVA